MNECPCCAAGESQLAIDLGGLVDAIHVGSAGVLGLRNIVTRNAGPKGVQRLDEGARFKAQDFGAWPSITLDPGARVGPLMNCTLPLLLCGRRRSLRLTESSHLLACLPQEHTVLLGLLALHTALHSVRWNTGSCAKQGRCSEAVGASQWA